MQKRQAKSNGTAPDIEKLTAQLLEAQQARVKACGEEVHQVLEKHKCTMEIAVQIGQQSIPLDRILTLPAGVSIRSK